MDQFKPKFFSFGSYIIGNFIVILSLSSKSTKIENGFYSFTTLVTFQIEYMQNIYQLTSDKLK